MKKPPFILLFLPSALGVKISSWPSPYWDIPGSYCQASYPQMKCCDGRKDRCSVPILGTLCYCDSFCDRTENSDCCPDYFSHCMGHSQDKLLYQTAPAAETIRRPDCPHGVLNISDPVCMFRGAQLSDRDTAQENCNHCKCQVSISKPGCMDVLCTTYQCMLEEKVISEVLEGEEKSIYTWTAANLTQFWGKTLEDGIKGKLGADKPDMMTRQMSAIQFSYSPTTLPTMFNTETAWPGLISGVTDQGWCSSSWAVSAAAVAGDRTSIGQNSPVVLSPQALLSCGKRGPVGCVGGQVDHAWDHLRRQGSWSSSCQSGSYSSCPTHCPLYRTQPAYRVGRGNTHKIPRRNEQDIMYELMTQGPAQAIMEIYTDFFMYGRGIYKKTNLASNTVAGYHAVRILGWGQEGVERYWKVANTWGTEWGEEGFFRIARGDNECMIEEFVLGVWPRKTRSPRMRQKRHRERLANRLFSSPRTRHMRNRHGRRPYRKGAERGAGGGKRGYFQVG